jgi:VanZ family protein
MTSALSSEPLDAGEARRFSHGLLVYVVLMALLATLSPFDFVAGPLRPLHVWWGVEDVALNLLLFFPAGFLWTLTRTRRSLLGALVLGTTLSLAVELAQMWLPGRHGNVVDVFANGLGALAGAACQRALATSLARVLSAERLLELPLTGSLYLLAPVLMLHGFAARDPLHASLAFPLCPFVATIASALYRRRLERPGAPHPPRYMALFASAFVALQLPAVLIMPYLSLAFAGGVLICAAPLASRREAAAPVQRRFEVRTVLRALPWYALFMLGLATFSASAGPSHAGFEHDARGQAFVLLRTVASCTLLGYLFAELRSRSTVSERALVASAALLGMVTGLAFTLPKGTHQAAALSVVLLSLAAAAAAGALLHRAQVRVVRALAHLAPDARPAEAIATRPPPRAPS